MKIKIEHYNTLKNAIAPLKEHFERHRENIIKEGKSKNIEMRLRWDAFHAAKYGGILSDLYAYANDEHIDTALKKIMLEIV
jgi:hypothetical protein